MSVRIESYSRETLKAFGKFGPTDKKIINAIVVKLGSARISQRRLSVIEKDVDLLLHPKDRANSLSIGPYAVDEKFPVSSTFERAEKDFSSLHFKAIGILAQAEEIAKMRQENLKSRLRDYHEVAIDLADYAAGYGGSIDKDVVAEYLVDAEGAEFWQLIDKLKEGHQLPKKSPHLNEVPLKDLSLKRENAVVESLVDFVKQVETNLPNTNDRLQQDLKYLYKPLTLPEAIIDRVRMAFLMRWY